MVYITKTFRGKSPVIAPSAFIAEGAVIIGDAHIGDNSSVWFNAVLRADVNPIFIGENTNIQDGTVVHTSILNGHTEIGNNVTIGHLAMIHACKIMDYAFIGMQSIIMDKVIVEEYSIVAAGALVSPGKVVRSKELWAGVPAKFIRKISEEEIEMIKLSSINYVKISKEYA